MAGWSGWVNDILRALGAPVVNPTQTFLQQWGADEQTRCRSNPLIASRHAPGSTDCKPVTATRVAQNYTGPRQGTNATVAQMSGGDFPHLYENLKGGTIWEPGPAVGVYNDLIRWGAVKFAEDYKAFFGSNFGSGGPTSDSTGASHVHKGYRDLNKQVTAAIVSASNARAELAYATRRLHRGRRVG